MDIYEKITNFYESVNTEKQIIGKSFLGRNIYALKIGNGKPTGLAQYAMHAREWITAELALFHYARGLEKGLGSLWLIPLTNPDGALLCQKGLDSVQNQTQKDFLRDISGGDNFALWKANGRGVDLNVNFDACWGKGKQNTKSAGGENYIGGRPFSETETQALRVFTLAIKPEYTISFHTKGEEIYWYFHQPICDCARDKALALAIAKSTGYALSYAKGSAGGYKDWCVQKLKIPSFTVEVGADELAHPIGEENLQDIILRNTNALSDLAKEYKKLQ